MKTKATIPFLLIIALALNIEVRSQDPKSASKVYYTPIKDKIYFAIDVTWLTADSLYKNDELLPNTLGKVDPVAPIYKPNGDYNTGDVVRILAKEADFGDDLYFYAKIIGSIDSEMMARINNRIIDKANALFGEGKMEAWPEKFVQKKAYGDAIDEKAVDSDFYITSKLTIDSDILEDYYGRDASIDAGDSDNLLLFHVAEGTGAYHVNELNSSFFKIDIKWKQKAGKKGKRIGGASENSLTSEDKNMISTYELIAETEGEYQEPVNGWIFMNGKADELVEMNSKYFEIKMNKAIDKAFSKIKI